MCAATLGLHRLPRRILSLVSIARASRPYVATELIKSHFAPAVWATALGRALHSHHGVAQFTEPATSLTFITASAAGQAVGFVALRESPPRRSDRLQPLHGRQLLPQLSLLNDRGNGVAGEPSQYFLSGSAGTIAPCSGGCAGLS